MSWAEKCSWDKLRLSDSKWGSWEPCPGGSTHSHYLACDGTWPRKWVSVEQACIHVAMKTIEKSEHSRSYPTENIK